MFRNCKFRNCQKNIPQIIIYKLNIFKRLILKLLVKVRYACILNILSNKMIIPEITNSNLNCSRLLKNFVKLIDDDKFRTDQINSINNNLHFIEAEKSPYDVSAEKIKSV